MRLTSSVFAHVRPVCSSFSAEGGEVNSFGSREKRGTLSHQLSTVCASLNPKQLVSQAKD